ncbi:DUF2231 domain-containing protein [Paenibacillus sp. TAF58]
MQLQLHPMIVHFPIVMLILGVITLWISIWKPNGFEKLANFLLIGGFITLIFAFFSGNASMQYAKQHLRASHTAIDTHQKFAFLTIIVFSLTLLVQYIRKKSSKSIFTGLVLILSLAGLVLLTIAGHYGGKLVYP